MDPTAPLPAKDPASNDSGKPLEWSPLPAGSFTGINYSEPGAADGLDPYLVWADINGFANLVQSGATDRVTHLPTWLPVLISLAKDRTPGDLATPARSKLIRVPDAYTNPRAGLPKQALIPATISGGFFNAFRVDRTLRASIDRIELDLPRDLSSEQQLPPLDRPLLTGMPCANSASGKVIAFIDDGCAFAHQHFRTGNPNQPATLHTRVQRLWDQNPRPGKPNGRDFSGAELDVLIQAHTADGRLDEAGIYAEFAGGNADPVNRLRARVAHGTHVLDLACGPYFLEDTMCARLNAPAANPSWEKIPDDANRAPIIFVQLPTRTVQDTSGRGTMVADVINAFAYIIAQCAPDVQIVVNLSWGTLAGPHAGSSVLERHIDALIVAMSGRLQVTIPAGNGYQSRTHALLQIEKGNSQRLLWRVQPDDTTESYLELWMEPGTKIAIRVTLPSGQVLPLVQQGNIFRYAQPSSNPISLFSVNYATPLPGTSPCVLFAVAPTSSLTGLRPVAPHGLWTIEVTVVGVAAGRTHAIIDGYIERDDVALGTRRGARQSRFEDPFYDKEAKEDSTTGPGASAAVRREGGFNGIATGVKIVAAGGIRESDGSEAEYSPRNTLPPRPSTRPGAQRKVDEFAVTEESVTLHGVRAAGSLSGSTMRLSGTSDAAPQIARDLFNAL
jgi:hypothetical protein